MPPQQRNIPNDDESEPSNHNNHHAIRRIVSQSEISVSSETTSPKNASEYKVRKSSLIGMINWTHVMLADAPQIMFFLSLLLLGQIIHQVVDDLELHSVPLNWTTVTTVIHAIVELFQQFHYTLTHLITGLDLFSTAVKVTFVLLCLGTYMMRQRCPVYLLSFATWKAPDSWKVSHAQIVELMRRQKCFNEESLGFLQRILERSGTGQATAWPPGIIRCLEADDVKADRSIEGSRKEAETIIFEIVEEALQKANVHPREIDVLVINCSLFSPTPSLCAMVLSHFNMRSDVATYNLSGMGCAASLISIDLAQKLLAGRGKNGKALVVSTEIITPNFYHGNDRGFLIQNTLFRCGGAAIVLSNSWLDGRRAWYKLLHTVRVQGTGQAAYECVFEAEDKNGERGVRLSKDIVKVAGKCMEKNFTVLGPSVLPLTEQARVVISIILRFLVKMIGKIMTNYFGMEKAAKQNLPDIKPYVPDFKRGIDHFCIHAGGRAVIDGIEKNMRLEPFHTEASRMTLLNYGNTSSSSIWYELEYIQELQKTNKLKKGDRVLQVAFGSGFKCTSGVWLKL